MGYTIRHVSWPLASVFAISRGARTTAEVVTVEVSRNGHTGRGECVPYAHYGESVESVIAQLEEQRDAVEAGLDTETLQQRMPPGAARNALDCALWDLKAKQTGRRVWQLLGLDEPGALTTAYTLSLDTPDAMAANAERNRHRPLMKLKLTGEGDMDRVAAVRGAAPDASLIVDANEGWSPEMVEPFSARLAELGVLMIEQPLPAGKDAALANLTHPVPICADEAAHVTSGLPDLIGKYDVINIKLDKTGGLTEAMKLKSAAMDAGLDIMVGCMIGSSLAMAPAMLVAQGARFVDLDGPLLLGRDYDPPLAYEGSTVYPPDPALWG